MKTKVLIVDDDQTICFSLKSLFEDRGYSVQDVQDGTSALNIFDDQKNKASFPEVVLLDCQLPDMSGLKVLEKIKEVAPDTSVIIITGFGSVPQSVDAMRKGAADYVLKPFNIDEILLRVCKALENHQLKERVSFLSEKVYGGWDEKYALCPNAQMQKLYQNLESIAKSPSTTVLILGETGTGKEVVANRVHHLSNRRENPFVAVNATALTADLLESELFGHESGAFTGAVATKKGLFEVADGGTLFLDEIGDMDGLLQAKILRALQERTIRRVGGTENIEVDIRLIAASNKNLEEAVRKGEFREDLYYRLNVVPVEIPPLRERGDDIEVLVNHFVKGFNREFHRSVKKVEPAALEMLKRQTWPGNVRELRNMVERAMLMECDGEVLKLTHLKMGKMQSGAQRFRGSLGNTIPLETVEREHIEGVLETTGGNKNQAAQILGIDRTTLYNKLKKYQLSS